LKVSKFLIFPLFLIIFSSSFVPFSFASVETEAQEDIRAGCRDGNTLVYRFAYRDYVCVLPSAAEKWVEYGMAEIISEFEPVEQEEPPQQTPQSYGATPPPPEKTIRVPIYDSECRAGYILIYQFSYKTTKCIEFSTAKSWERLGLAEIVTPVDKIKVEYEEESEEYDLEEFKEVSNREEQRKQDAEKLKQISLPPYPDQPSIRPELEATNDFLVSSCSTSSN